MRFLPLLILVVALLLGSIVGTVLDSLRFVSHAIESGQISNDELLVGHVHHLLLTSFIWRQYPGNPPDLLRVWHFDATAALLVLPLVACAYYFVRIKMRKPLYLVGVASLPAAVLPYAVGLLALRGNTVAERCGPWMVTMLLGLLYALGACVLFCGWECCRSSRILDRVRRFAKTCWADKRKLRWYQFNLKHLLLAMALVAVLLSPVSVWLHNRSRVAAFSHLRRDQRSGVLLDTWLIPPREVLESFPETKTIIGIKRPWPDWMQEFVGVRIVNVRLCGDGVDDTDLAALEHFPEMEYLELVETKVTDEGVEMLQQALPKLRIVRVARPERRDGRGRRQRSSSSAYE